MSVWPNTQPCGAPALSGAEGALVLVSIAVEPRRLESLLEVLANVGFPINPQLCHEGSPENVELGEQFRDLTLVEFPAYEDRVAEVRRTLSASGFDPASVRVSSMLDWVTRRAPAGAKQSAAGVH
jgi:hypothetical protein